MSKTRGIGAVLIDARRNEVGELTQAMLDMFPTPWEPEARSSRTIIRAKNGVQVLGGINDTKAAFIMHRVNTFPHLIAAAKALLDDKDVTYAVRALRLRDAIANAEGTPLVAEQRDGEK